MLKFFAYRNQAHGHTRYQSIFSITITFWNFPRHVFSCISSNELGGEKSLFEKFNQSGRQLLAMKLAIDRCEKSKALILIDQAISCILHMENREKRLKTL